MGILALLFCGRCLILDLVVVYHQITTSCGSGSAEVGSGKSEPVLSSVRAKTAELP